MYSPRVLLLIPARACIVCGPMKEEYIKQSGYMRQANTGYLESLTVVENLVYAAMIRFPATLDAQSRRVQT